MKPYEPHAFRATSALTTEIPVTPTLALRPNHLKMNMIRIRRTPDTPAIFSP